jgi:hypothetical protein
MGCNDRKTNTAIQILTVVFDCIYRYLWLVTSRRGMAGSWWTNKQNVTFPPFGGLNKKENLCTTRHWAAFTFFDYPTSMLRHIMFRSSNFSLWRSQWPRGLKRVSAGVRLLGLWVRIPLERSAWMSAMSIVCFQGEVSVTSWSLVQRSSADCCVSGCDHEYSIMRRPWPTGGLLRHGNKFFFIPSLSYFLHFSLTVCYLNT